MRTRPKVSSIDCSWRWRHNWAPRRTRHRQPASAPAVGTVEALAGLSRSEAGLIFGQAGHLVHYGADTEPLKSLIALIASGQRGEAPDGARVRPGDEVRLVGDPPESVAEVDETWLRETRFAVRHVGSGVGG